MATAVVTSAMLRTWPVRLPAIEFTLSVRSLQVPETPSTCAWPPSLPSVPTSRATRVTSEAKEPSWSTIVLMVFFSSSISPRTSTVIFLDKSPLATAVVTSAMLRTWPVRFPAMELTLSVRSFQVPATPRTSAWPPSLPSVPTSRATRVTSEAKELSWSTMMLMVFLSSRISPSTSTVIFLERSPLATAVVTSAMLRIWAVRLPAMELTLSVRSFQVPETPRTSAWPPSLPSRADLARHAGDLRGEGAQLVHHRVDGVLEFQELAFDVRGDLLGQIAVGDGGGDLGDVAHLAGEVAGHQVHVVGEVLPGARDASHIRLAAELALGADLAGHAGDLRGEGTQLVHHRVDRAGGAQKFALQGVAVEVEGHRLRKVALGHRADDPGHLARWLDQVGDQFVDQTN